MLPVHAIITVVLTAATGLPCASPGPARDASSVVREAARSLGAVAAAEPDVLTIEQAAEARAAPSREDAESWRRRARLAGLLPRLTAEYRHDERSLRASGISSGEEIDYVRLMPGDTVLVRLSWDLDELLFGRSELAAGAATQAAQVRRHEAAEKAIRLYFERLRIRLALLSEPPASVSARAEVELQLATVTAQLHALTGLYGEELR